MASRRRRSAYLSKPHIYKARGKWVVRVYDPVAKRIMAFRSPHLDAGFIYALWGK
jgi:hypothetical protein